MADSSIEIPLPFAVEQMLQDISLQRFLPPAAARARRSLAMIGEQASVEILTRIASTTDPIRTLDGYIIHLAKNCPDWETISRSPQKRSSSSFTDSDSPSKYGSYNSRSPKKPICSPCSSSKGASPRNNIQQSPNRKQLERTRSSLRFEVLVLLAELEFEKSFMILSYIGRKTLEDVVSVEDAVDIYNMRNDSMFEFESQMWNKYGCKYCQRSDRAVYLDWDSGKARVYYCFVNQDGSYYFKGPYLNTTRTHLQRALGDENVLIVKFVEVVGVSNMATSSRNWNAAYDKIAEGGILVGLTRYRFFVFKDGGKEVKINSREDKKKSQNSRAVKCYFIRMESLAPWIERAPYVLSQKTVRDARCLFMHVHMVPSMAKYISRLSLVLSQTIKLQVDLASVLIERIMDIPCRDENGCALRDKDGQPLIHTDGTGFISEDLAMLCPKDFYDVKYIKDENFERSLDHVQLEEKPMGLRGREACIREPPLLIQCRLFNKGCAVKGTLLVNKKLKQRTIQIRPSMVKVEQDSRLSNVGSFDSLEIVAVSHKPKNAKLSKNLIALLSIGGVPREYFMGLLESTLEDGRRVCTSIRAALRVALNHGGMDDYNTSAQMITFGVPLDEPCLKHRLSQLASEERKALGEGKLPISESFYLMGTVDPTGVLNRDEVCIILDNGQISGKVLVYRNPGLHFGDIHVVKAVYVKALEDYVGNSKYAIFFSTKGRRSVATEIANGDFDGDMYWVSRNPQLLSYFRASEPWRRVHATPNASSKNPSDFSHEELEHELFKQLLNTRNQSSVAGVAADSWQTLMDRFLILGDDNGDEKDQIKKKMLMLIDIYYDALDASKSGKMVEVPEDLRAQWAPHYLERGKPYDSSSILGQIYDRVQTFQTEELAKEEIWKLPCFDVKIPDACLRLWKERYDVYRREMSTACSLGDESKNDSANSVIKKYKQMLYGAAEFEESTKKIEDIFDEALAIYHACYDYAMSTKDANKCRFAWRVAGAALCKFYNNQNGGERAISCLPSILRDVIC